VIIGTKSVVRLGYPSADRGAAERYLAALEKIMGGYIA